MSRFKTTSLYLACLLTGAEMKSARAGPLAYFAHSAGPAARPTQMLDWIYTAICGAVCVIVALLLAVALWRRRERGAAGDIVKGGDGLRWVYIGTGLSTLVLLGMLIYALVVLDQVGSPPRAPGLTIDVTGYDWWWRADYGRDDPVHAFSTANEIHIPVGVPVLVRLHSADVIHAFWVPDLAGKTQMIPGLDNRQWLQADKPGIYRGQCTQFCGVQHAHMAFDVVAQDPAEFQAWLENQRRTAPSPASGSAKAGEKVFMTLCAACHAVRGSAAQGDHGPDLTHLMTRRQIAAGLLDNTPDNRQYWIGHAQESKPGVRMPDIPLTATQNADLSAYLATLK